MHFHIPEQIYITKVNIILIEKDKKTPTRNKSNWRFFD
jgi:hypothetical protein